MTTDKKTAEEIKTDILFLYNKRPVEELVEYVMKLITPSPIQEGEVVYRKISVKERLPKTEGWYTIFLDDLSQAAYFNTEDFSPTPKMDLEDENDNIEASHWLEPITISQAKQGGYSENDMRTFAYKTWHKSDTISNGYEYQLWENSYIEYLLQAHPDHIPDSGKLVKTMSVELPSDEEIEAKASDKYTDGLREEAFRKGAKWLRGKIQSQLSTPPAPMTIEEAKDFACKFSNWIYGRGYVKYAGGNMWYHENHAGGDKTIEELCKDFIKDFPIQHYIKSQQPK